MEKRLECLVCEDRECGDSAVDHEKPFCEYGFRVCPYCGHARCERWNIILQIMCSFPHEGIITLRRAQRPRRAFEISAGHLQRQPLRSGHASHLRAHSLFAKEGYDAPLTPTASLSCRPVMWPTSTDQTGVSGPSACGSEAKTLGPRRRLRASTGAR